MRREFGNGLTEPWLRALDNEARLHELGLADDPLIQHYRWLGNPDCAGEKTAKRFGRTLEKRLNHAEWHRAMNLNSAIRLPQLDPASSVVLGHEVKSGTPYRLSHDSLRQHVIIVGGTGAGKTVACFNIVKQASRIAEVSLFDHKDEAGRFARMLPDAVIIPPARERWNVLRGERDQGEYVRFFGDCFGRARGLASITEKATTARLQRLCGNVCDLPAVADLSEVFHSLADIEGRQNLHSAAKAWSDLSTVMGYWARVRQEPTDGYERHRVRILCRKDMPSSLEVFLSRLFFKRKMDRATARGHSKALQELFVFDEGRGFFGRELEAPTGSGRLNVQTEILTKFRSYGLPLVICTQSATKLQPAVLDNASTFICVGANSDDEAKFCCSRLGLPERDYRRPM